MSDDQVEYDAYLCETRKLSEALDAARRQNDELAVQLAEAREGYMMLPEDLEVQRLRAEVKRQTVNVTALCDDNERLAGERDEARADAVEAWQCHPDMGDDPELEARIEAHQQALDATKPPDR